MTATTQKPVVILGAGLAGLTAANFLKSRNVPVVLYEAGNKIAGLAQSFHDADGFTYDFGAHFVTNRLAKAVGIEDKCRTVKHYAETVWLGGKSYSHPFGLMRLSRMTMSGISTKLKSLGGGSQKSETAADRFRASYGAALADEVAIPLTEAWSGAKAEDLSPARTGKSPASFNGCFLFRIDSPAYSASRRQRADLRDVDYGRIGAARLKIERGNALPGSARARAKRLFNF